jgi:enamine deaminase RidA (YjgF/YER057c/UK114 family)
MTELRSNAINFINPPALAQPPGYSNVVEVRSGRIIFIAGQVATDQQGQLVGGSDFEAQAEQVFRNLAAALASVGCTPNALVKLTVFLRDINHLPLYRKARDRFFQSSTPPAAPAVTLVEVSSLFAKDYLLEIEGVAAP